MILFESPKYEFQWVLAGYYYAYKINFGKPLIRLQTGSFKFGWQLLAF
jgi:hypothetical protein